MVKSPPELWAELSEVEGLERHLGEFGEITITRAEPESTVAWEGENASGTVELEPTGWGTKVTITAAVDDPPPQPEAVPEPEPEPQARVPEAVAETAHEEPAAADPGPFDPDPDPFDPEPLPVPRKRGFFARWLFRERRAAPGAHPAHRLTEFPEQPEPQLPDWSPPAPAEAEAEAADDHAQPALEDEDAHVPDLLSPTDTGDFEFDFEIRRADDPPVEDEDPPEPIAPERAREVLETALENLGQAHHRPFSRG